MTLSLRHLKLVQEVAREGTLTRAAKRLYLTQSALSHQLGDLERHVGAHVFTRVGKRMVLTPAGLRILDSAQSTLGEMKKLNDDLKRIAEGTLGQIRLTTQCHTAYHWLPAVLPTFRKKHPAIEFRVVPDAADRPVAALLNGEVDLALMYGEELDVAIHAVPLFEDEQVLIVSPDHPLLEKAYVSADDFSQLDLIVYNATGKPGLLFEKVLNPEGVVPRRVSEVKITEGIVSLVSAGVGAAVVTRWSVAPDIRLGNVAALKITEFGLQRSWYAAVLNGQQDHDYMMSFITLLQRGPNWILDTRKNRKDLPFAGLRAQA